MKRIGRRGETSEDRDASRCQAVSDRIPECARQDGRFTGFAAVTGLCEQLQDKQVPGVFVRLQFQTCQSKIYVCLDRDGGRQVPRCNGCQAIEPSGPKPRVGRHHHDPVFNIPQAGRLSLRPKESRDRNRAGCGIHRPGQGHFVIGGTPKSDLHALFVGDQRESREVLLDDGRSEEVGSTAGEPNSAKDPFHRPPHSLAARQRERNSRSLTSCQTRPASPMSRIRPRVVWDPK